MLIDPANPRNTVGTLYKLEGLTYFGMELRIRERFDYENSRSFRTNHELFPILQSSRNDFTAIVEQTQRPHDPRTLT
jgi:hypothetical protein